MWWDCGIEIGPFLGPKLEPCWQKNRGNTMPFIKCDVNEVWSCFVWKRMLKNVFFAKIPQKKHFFFSPSPGRLRREDVERSWFRCGIPRDYDNEHCRNGNVKYEHVGTQSSKNPRLEWIQNAAMIWSSTWLRRGIHPLEPFHSNRRLGTQQEAFHNLDG